MRGKFEKWIDELKGFQSELEEVLEWNLAEAENDGDRVEKMEGIMKLMRSHHEYLQGLEFQLFDLDVLILTS